MQRIYLEKRDLEKNQSRFYTVTLSLGIFGEWAVVREWGRIGSPGTVRSDWYATQESARQAMEILQKQKSKRGYVIKI